MGDHGGVMGDHGGVMGEKGGATGEERTGREAPCECDMICMDEREKGEKKEEAIASSANDVKEVKIGKRQLRPAQLM